MSLGADPASIAVSIQPRLPDQSHVGCVPLPRPSEWLINSVVRSRFDPSVPSRADLAPRPSSPQIMLGEVWEWKALLSNENGTLRTFLVGSAVTGTFGFFICMAGLLSITVTSPVSHMFSSVSRARSSLSDPVKCLLPEYVTDLHVTFLNASGGPIRPPDLPRDRYLRGRPHRVCLLFSPFPTPLPHPILQAN